MRKSQKDADDFRSRQPQPVRCQHCGREMFAAGCANLHCPGIRWRQTPIKGMDRVELCPSVQRSASRHGFVGTLYTKEIRLVDGCECQGVSASTVAFGSDKKQVAEQIAAAVTQRARLYAYRGYRVTLKKLMAA